MSFSTGANEAPLKRRSDRFGVRTACLRFGAGGLALCGAERQAGNGARRVDPVRQASLSKAEASRPHSIFFSTPSNSRIPSATPCVRSSAVQLRQEHTVLPDQSPIEINFPASVIRALASQFGVRMACLRFGAGGLALCGAERQAGNGAHRVDTVRQASLAKAEASRPHSIFFSTPPNSRIPSATPCVRSSAVSFARNTPSFRIIFPSK